MEAIYLIVAVAAIIAIYFLLFRQAESGPPRAQDAKARRPKQGQVGVRAAKPSAAEPEAGRSSPAGKKKAAEGRGGAKEDGQAPEDDRKVAEQAHERPEAVAGEPTAEMSGETRPVADAAYDSPSNSSPGVVVETPLALVEAHDGEVAPAQDAGASAAGAEEASAAEDDASTTEKRAKD